MTVTRIRRNLHLFIFLGLGVGLLFSSFGIPFFHLSKIQGPPDLAPLPALVSPCIPQQKSPLPWAEKKTQSFITHCRTL